MAGRTLSTDGDDFERFFSRKAIVFCHRLGQVCRPMNFATIKAGKNMQPLKKRIASGKPTVWLFYGDSITHGAEHTYGGRDFTEHFSERIRYEMNRKQDIVVNTAFSGNNTRVLLDDFERRVAMLKPDVVFLMIGYNDCSNQIVPLEQYQSNLRELCSRIQAIGAIPILQTSNTFIPGQDAAREPYAESYMNALREVAEADKLPLIDHYRFWRDNPIWTIFWLGDALHPNAYGHLIMAKYIIAALGIFDANSFVCQQFAPIK